MDYPGQKYERSIEKNEAENSSDESFGYQSPTNAAAGGVGTGLLLMAVFTTAWAALSQSGWQGRDHRIVLVIFAILSAVFFYYGCKLLASSGKFPSFRSEIERSDNRRLAHNFQIVFGLEGIGILVVCVTLSGLGFDRFINCGIALVVGIHFYPMASIFKRTVDYYIATWSCVVALSVAWLLFKDVISGKDATAFLGLGMALATSSYGVYMVREGRRFLKGLQGTGRAKDSRSRIG